VLTAHDAVSEACVVGVPDDARGEVVVAAYVATRPVTVEELTAHCRAQLAPFKVPRRLLRLDALPTTVTGKPSRREVRELFLGPSGSPSPR
jgi:acyl-coenzyme A synthetase/AMP-(fatty) acid ligase